MNVEFKVRPQAYDDLGIDEQVCFTSAFQQMWRNEGKKTMFDPCPPGYCVPVYEDILAIKMSGVEIDLPKAGAIWYDLDPSGLKMLSRAGFYGTSSLSEGSRSRSIDFYVYEDKTGLKSEYCNASGFSVRPQKINNKQ